MKWQVYRQYSSNIAAQFRKEMKIDHKYDIDHKFSVRAAYLIGIDLALVNSFDNLIALPIRENRKKHDMCSISYEELMTYEPYDGCVQHPTSKEKSKDAIQFKKAQTCSTLENYFERDENSTILYSEVKEIIEENNIQSINGNGMLQPAKVARYFSCSTKVGKINGKATRMILGLKIKGGLRL